MSKVRMSEVEASMVLSTFAERDAVGRFRWRRILDERRASALFTLALGDRDWSRISCASIARAIEIAP